jgi:CheY-like chemotaxis protein
MFQENDALLDKDFGIPKLNIKLARALLKKLKGRFELIEKGDSKDYGFIFPVDYNSAPEIKSPVIGKPASDQVIKEQPPVKEEPVRKSSPPKPEELPAPAVKEMDLDDILSEEEIEIESELSSLETELAAKPKMPQQEIRETPKLDLSKLKCIYIEDQVDSQILFKVQLKDLQDIKFAVSFEEALPLLDNNRFDFILIDINLQGEYNGIDALKIIQNMPGYKNVPLIAVTAYVLPGDRERFIATGFNDFIAKPLFREKLVNSLERIFLMQE